MKEFLQSKIRKAGLNRRNAFMAHKKLKQWLQNRYNMVCMITYDIKDNKIRRYLVKYLEKKGLERLQKSVFAGNIKRDQYHEILKNLSEVAQMYENNDSILIIPLSSELNKAFTIIGKEINISENLEPRNLVIF